MRKLKISPDLNDLTELSNFVQLIKNPWKKEDLILPNVSKQVLENFINEAKNRKSISEKVLTSKPFSKRKGLICLFSGSSGTEKTMAAQVIASRLELDLYRIDLSLAVNKYIGETEKNLKKIFDAAENGGAILLFEEADALFGKRTEIKDAHDRYSNTDTNYLLSAIENYRGIAILSSNRKSNIDSGFTRRLRYVIEFSKQDSD